ncbi:MAG: formylglycine-generating enzyme family protein [Armatimonadetes bacterium]|nr:formylglycine-generating enzyme family protein [Armatimonadota bacterium]
MLREMVMVDRRRMMALAGLAVACALLAVRSLPAQDLQPYTESLEGTLVTFDMVPTPGGAYEFADPNAEGAATTVEIKPFWIGKTEVTWDEYDVYLLRLDDPNAGGNDAQGSGSETVDADGLSRPSKPYGAPDLGFGHQGFAAMHLSSHAALNYCKWLSHKTGKKYRLPTEAEWEFACRAGQLPAGPLEDTGLLGKLAWHFDTSEMKTHQTASAEPNAWGIHDMLGNVGEWCATPEQKPALRGGSFQEDAADVHPAARRLWKASWQMADPQIPKSKWWLSDAPFAGFRVVCEP